MTSSQIPADPLRIAAQFGAIMLGNELTDEPPAPGTPLHRLQTLVRRRNAGELDKAAFDDAVWHLHQDG